jgi:hypothetical protein
LGFVGQASCSPPAAKPVTALIVEGHFTLGPVFPAVLDFDFDINLATLAETPTFSAENVLADFAHTRAKVAFVEFGLTVC